MKNKANWFKGIATVGGISTGALLGTASTAALVGGPAGWLLGGALLAVAATVGICALIKNCF